MHVYFRRHLDWSDDSTFYMWLDHFTPKHTSIAGGVRLCTRTF